MVTRRYVERSFTDFVVEQRSLGCLPYREAMSGLNANNAADTLANMSEAPNSGSPSLRTRSMRLLVEAALVTAIVVGAVAYQRQRTELRKLAATLNEFCGTTESEVASVIRDLENENPTIRSHGLKRFYNSSDMHTNKLSFAMCLDDVPALPGECVARDDMPCLVGVARDIELKLHRRNTD